VGTLNRVFKSFHDASISPRTKVTESDLNVRPFDGGL
jgi:hypothetical protein